MPKEPNEFDINKAAAEFVKNNLTDILKLGTKAFSTLTQKVQLRLDRTYNSYLKSVATKCSRTKSFFIRSEPVYLYSFYVPITVSHRRSITEAFSYHNLARCSIITGSGGTGKSMLMKHLVLSGIVEKQKVPIFIQLQHLNQGETRLEDLIHRSLVENQFRLSEDYIQEAIKHGHFALFLDGLDEVVESKRQEVHRAIRDFARVNDKNVVVVSSRQDQELEGWQDFTLYRVQPLTLDLATELVSKLQYDEELKGKFLEDLQTSLFKKHESFLSNPLLLSIMLLTYGQSANIPEKLNVFYNQAYEALFERHDALKGGYSRLRKTKLDIQDFARVFSAFCLQAYDKGLLEFTRLECLELIEKTKGLVGIAVSKEDYLKDLLQGVCLLVEDGLNIVFVHRSFQEYFTARFIADVPPNAQKQLVDRYSLRVNTSNVLELLYEMRPEPVEKYYLLPQLDKLFKALSYTSGEFTTSQFLKFLGLDVECISFEGKKVHFYRDAFDDAQARLTEFAAFALNTCGKLVGRTEPEDFEKTFPINKYSPATGVEQTFTVQDLTPEDELTKDLFRHGSFFSVKTLQVLVKIRDALRDRAARQQTSLEDILKSAN